MTNELKSKWLLCYKEAARGDRSASLIEAALNPDNAATLFGKERADLLPRTNTGSLKEELQNAFKSRAPASETLRLAALRKAAKPAAGLRPVLDGSSHTDPGQLAELVRVIKRTGIR